MEARRTRQRREGWSRRKDGWAVIIGFLFLCSMAWNGGVGTDFAHGLARGEGIGRDGDHFQQSRSQVAEADSNSLQVSTSEDGQDQSARLPKYIEAAIPDVDGYDENEWRKLGPDESVPIGSHVRIDMSSGEKFVKLEVDTDCTQDDGETCERIDELDEPPSSVQSELGDDVTSLGKEHEDVQRMERVLFGLPKPDERLKDIIRLRKIDPKAYEEALKRVWNARQEEIRAAMDLIANEAEIIKDHIAVLIQENSTVDDKVYALQELEWFVQDLDKASDFAFMKGFEVTTLMLEHDSAQVRTNAAYVIGSAIKSISSLQSLALESGAFEKLLSRIVELAQELNSPTPTHDARLETVKVLYAIGAFLRGNESAQVMAHRENFTDTLMQLLNLPDQGFGENAKINVKTVALIEDMLREEHDCNPAERAAEEQSPDILVVPISNSEDSPEKEEEKRCHSPLVGKLTQTRDLCTSLVRNVKNLVEHQKTHGTDSLRPLQEKLATLFDVANCHEKHHQE